jgi:hypothetical protein
LSEESTQKHLTFPEPEPVTTVQGDEYIQYYSLGGLIVLSAKPVTRCTKCNKIKKATPKSEPKYPIFKIHPNSVEAKIVTKRA